MVRKMLILGIFALAAYTLTWVFFYATGKGVLEALLG
jgi:hypothetical protein